LIDAREGIETENNILLGFLRKTFLYHVLFTKKQSPYLRENSVQYGGKGQINKEKRKMKTN